MDNRLTTIEQARAKENVTTTTAIAMVERAAAVKKLEETKSIMASTGHALLKSKMEDPHLSSTPEIVQEVTNNLITGSTLQGVTMPSPPPQSPPSQQ